MDIFDTEVKFPEVDASCGMEPSLREILIRYYSQAFTAKEAAASAKKYIDLLGAEAEVARLRAEVEGLRKVLAPFAEYERVRSTMGGTSPKSGQLLGVHSSAGSAELSVEDFKAAIAAMGASA
ncbi:TPA: hypothetical protein ACKPZV_000191 [Stenotrophomonas maltophilia]